VRDLYGRLTFSQKTAFVLLVAVVVISLVMFTSWGSRGEYIAVTREPLGAARAEVLAALEGAGIATRESAAGLEVPAGRYNEAVAILATYNIVGSEQIQIRLADIAKDDKMFRTSEDKRAQRLVALQNWLGDVVAHMENIRQATVALDAPDARGWVLEEERGTASVQVWLQPGIEHLSKKQVNGIAALVSGVRRTIRKSDVNIVDQTGRAYRVPSDDEVAGGVADRHEQQLMYEGRLAREVRDMLSYFSVAKVMVRLKVNFDVETVRETDYGPEGYAETMVTSTETKNMTTTGAGSDTTVPGTAAALGTGGGSKSETEKSKTSQRKVNEKVTSLVKAPGGVEDVAVTVFVPRDEVVQQITSRGVAEDQAASQIDTELNDIRTSLASMLMVSDPQKVNVRAVTFPKPTPSETPVEAGFVGKFWTDHGRTTVLAGLSLVALFLLWRMVKKPVELVSGPSAGYAAEEVLTGFEGPSADARHSEKMERTVNDMVRQSPGDAANLVTRWVQSE
jgi:flagellar biosynthesis/type III secretory pathway M-ring protein FliF/YscJ